MLAAERAKIEISSKEDTTIFAADDEIRVKDAAGEDIYLDIGFARGDFERLISNKVDETIALSRKILKDNGYSHEEIDRAVFVGGPSKIPMLRERVARELGVATDIGIDPMTAVAMGAAIYAESREWEGNSTRRKKTRASAVSAGALGLKLDYPSRVTADRSRLKVSVKEAPANHEIQVESQSGWTSGRIKLERELAIELETKERGTNAFRILVFDHEGRPLPEEEVVIEIERGFASTVGIPATQTVAVKVIGDEALGRNALEPIIIKGTLLPAKGMTPLRAARALKGGDKGHIDLEVYQQEAAIADPELSLAVGVFRISGEDLPDGQSIGRGDKIHFHWEMNDSGILASSLELPSVNQTFDIPRYYVPQAGHKTFEGEDGAALVESSIDRTREDLSRAAQAIGHEDAGPIEELKRRLGQQESEAAADSDPDTRRAVTENARRIRQDLHRLMNKPEWRARGLCQELEELRRAFDRHVRKIGSETEVARFDELAAKAQAEIDRGTEAALDTAEQQVGEMRAVAIRSLWQNPAFIIAQFKEVAGARYRAIDKALHDSLVEEGMALLEQDNTDELVRIIGQLYHNQIHVGADAPGLGLASIMRA